jgi:uncharacterized protein (DUF1810 family)
MSRRGDDPFDLQRFVTAQNESAIYEQAVSELQRGRKTGHWMWFVFPQIAGLGASAISRKFAISCLPEARAYLHHPELGPRLIDCSGVVAETHGRSAEQIFGSIDAIKLRSSMTLFLRAEPEERLFGEVLDRYFEGIPDSATDQRL